MPTPEPVKLDKRLYDGIEIGLVDREGNAIMSHEEAEDDIVKYCLFGHLIEGGRDELQMDFDEEGDALEMASILCDHWNMEFSLEY